MKEIVIISGKGGTGKTSIAAALASMAAPQAVLADCDVDAADLHLILQPTIVERNDFFSGHQAHIRGDECVGCGRCESVCRFEAVHPEGGREAHTGRYVIDPVACEGCGVCVALCPVRCIDFPQARCGEWYVSDTRLGPMVHARLGVAAENSGRLVTLVRKEAQKIAQKRDAGYVIIDGSPGIGCPVIASLTAANQALIVTEPTVSGDHDLRRVAELTSRLNIPTAVCVNKWDINPEATEEIRRFADDHQVPFAGVVRYDAAVNAAQRCRQTLPEYTAQGVTEDIQAIWQFMTSERERT